MALIITTVIIGMMIWSGIEIVKTIARGKQSVSSPLPAKLQAEEAKDQTYHALADVLLEAENPVTGNAVDVGQCATEEAACEASSTAISHAVEGALNLLEH
ncbi:MAG: hypothetical protein F6K36_15405 [Symploca sp. SIO3C6]|uniref:Uncharacterized protein n=1 Tax=Symploca sp. SIO1C4 TaxID=2607765 RepID=A0A6B3NGR8_9CYAN|nr:hypothetical protein [Symploca sp. SIO3C6]NER29224.1 hypothetical protein [Symploca sp. SIO1C4]